MKLRRRLVLHFSFQFIMILLSIFFLLIFLLLYLANIISEDEMDVNFPEGLVEAIANITYVKDDEVDIDEKWEGVLEEQQMWLQIVNKSGDVIYSIHTPPELQTSYSVNDLLIMEESKTIGDYTVNTYYDSWTTDPYYYLLGYKDQAYAQLTQWYQSFSEQGVVNKENIANLKKDIDTLQGSLQIFQKGKLVQTIGDQQMDKDLSKLDVLGRVFEPGKHSTKVSIFNDLDYGVSWVLHTPNENSSKSLFPFFEREVVFLLLITFFSLLVAIILSIWNGFRYGQPLILFINWLDRMGKGSYTEVFTKKEIKKIFKRSGKTRHRYRLYQEVFLSFYQFAEKLNMAERERERLEKTREEWMAGISHDLRTPLSTIQGYGHLLESDKYEFSMEERIEIGRVIREKSHYMVQLVDDFSLVFQLKNSTITLDKKKVNMNEFTKSILDKYKKDLTIKPLRFSFYGDPHAVYAEIDEKWFTRVLDNVIYNAIKHNPPNTHIEAIVNQMEGNLFLTIRDDGKGMDNVCQKELFERYYRGTNTDEGTEGAGLGMSIAKAIVEQHNGEIEVDSALGIGTSVMIKLKKV